MNVEDLLRSELHSDAASVAPIDNLLEVSTQRGRRKQLRRRTAVAGTGVAAAAIVVAGSLAIAGSGNAGPQQQVNAAHGRSTPKTATKSAVTPWWTTWSKGRSFGPVDAQFLTAADPVFDTAKGPAPWTVWASGSESDGTDWAVYTTPSEHHAVNFIQGWNGQPDFGDSPQVNQPGLTWMSFESPTLANHNSTGNIWSQYLIIVGKPGTTSIKYAADGVAFKTEPVHDGITVIKLGNFPPADAQVQLATKAGVYATGTPEGAGVNADPTSSTTPDPGRGTSVPTATPSSGS